MSNYEAKIIKYCGKRILPRGYKINADLRRKLITLVEDAVINYSENGSFFDREKEDVLPCIEAGDVDDWICAACANADYLSEEEKLFLLKSFLRRKTEADRRMREQIGFVWSPQIPYQSCVSYLLEHEPLTEEYLLYLLMGDSESPNESFIRNFQILLNDRNLSDTVKIGYYLCLPNLGRRRDTSKRLEKATSILLDSEAVAKENRVKVFELLREPDLFMQIRKGFEELRKAKATDAGEVYFPPFIEDLFQSLVEMPEELQEEFLRNILNVIDFDFNCVRRQACDWYISQLPTLEEKKEAITRLIESVDNVKSNGDKYLKMCAYDALYSMPEELDADFVRQLLEQGSHSNLGDIRAHCYKYLLLLFDDAVYVEGCLNDTTKKVRETVVRTALSGTKMDTSTRLRLSRIIEEKKLKLTKKQKGRLKNLLEKCT
ncbi:MAG: hypothetical protein KAV25_03235 [Methanophagales archaeon]|nr:hypothetical protein [Methanophagales archaeon]